ncbi:MAG: hypothetical protein HZA93_12930 [Verrucomicrobia bacterium]|nr:hypothetical protein [Verrucomicrobiota bacterium]
MKPRLLAFLGAFAALAGARSAELPFAPLAAGPLGEVHMKEGDRAFLAEYFRGTDFAADPVASRLENEIGRQPPPGGLTSYAARWSATVMPVVSGEFTLSLRSTASAQLKLDGRMLLNRSAAATNFAERATTKLTLTKGKPYELVVEFINLTGRGEIAVEWRAVEGAAVTAAVRREAIAGPAAGTAIGAPAQLANATYTLDSRADGAFVVTEKATGASAVFAPEFAVVFQPRGHEIKLDPKGSHYLDDGPVGDTNYLVPTWDKEPDFLTAAHPRTRLRATAVERRGAALAWQFAPQPDYTISAEITLPADGTEPLVTMRLAAKSAGQFSLGYVGAPTQPMAGADWIWQPLVWQERRFPNRAYLTKEFECPIPFTLAGLGGNTVGVGADAREMPFRMPTNENSRFGVLVRNAAGEAQPQLFAPVLGGPDSAIAAGGSYTFAVRLAVRRGGWFDAFKHLARSLYGFRDYRENALRSLNTTIENMADYVLTDRFSYWYPRYKTWGYQNDGGPGAGRQQSAADALSLALVFDRAEFLERRSRPTLEYFLSRNTVSTKFAEPKFIGGHVNNACDLTAVYRLTGGRTTVIRELFARDSAGAETGKEPPPPRRNEIWVTRNALTTHLVNYRLTGDRRSLDHACAAADRYLALRIDRPAENFGDLGSSVWPELAAAFDLLYELHADTDDPRYLRAAVEGAQEFAAYVYLVPVIPDTPFTANPGGRYHNQPVPEEIVPAWRVAANGLTPEGAATAHSHRGIFNAPYAGWFARLARDAAEPFFSDIARSAVVGRYANYPSYAYRNGYTTLHQQADYPLRPFEEIKKFTSAHYNHPLPMTAFLVDFLVSDIYARSDALIDFPSEYTNTGAYFRNKVFGARPGKFYGDTGAYLWLPKRLVTADTVQLNYVAARGTGRLYLAFSNQAPREVTAIVTVDPARVALAGAHSARTWTNNQPGPALTVTDGRAKITVPAKGLVALAIDGAACTTEIQDAVLDPATPPLPAGSSQKVKTSFGEVTATALRFGRGLTSVHVWLKAGPEQVKHATCTADFGTGPQRFECAEFPYEFTIPVPDGAKAFRCHVETETVSGKLDLAELSVPLRS